ncbi:mechanosensitive ion channel domain-containing protein [Flavicella sp.]|uniref:mechanosensitive ion channel family protein n=1 Tax=Flavicella sp. TaxID=2957742 RepID=UPI00262A2038|nr:mechanosensitive ion channel domain-containing protein [Flavicella sp.]MDG1805280.1 mechanosensitive ion channel [Flavicella sp.]
MEELNELLNFELYVYQHHSLTVFEVVTATLLFFATKLILWLIKKALDRETRIHNIDTGNSFAMFQIIKYFIWIIVVIFMLEIVGVKISVLLAGSAALLVGIGLGFQQTFNDILSGVLLLFEKSVKVGDILDIDGEIVIIEEIGLRTSQAKTRMNIVILIPNSIITTNKVINWSNQSRRTQFVITVGVAYGSDVTLVMKLLQDAATSHNEVLEDGTVQVRLSNFGNSSLDFSLLFSSVNIFEIERIKSDIRIVIEKKFQANDISIPFPQLDVHMNNSNPIK